MGRPSAGTPRLDASLTDPPTVQRAQRLMALLQAGNAELFRGALDILEWCVKQVREGRHIASLDETGDVARAREFSSPLLEAARQDDRRLELHAEAFDRVTQLLEAPPQPTPALRELMAETYARQATARR
jgi:hypothetical protein